MPKENASLGFRIKKVDETRNNFLEKLKHNDLISKNSQKSAQGFKLL